MQRLLFERKGPRKSRDYGTEDENVMEWDSAVDTAPCCRAITLNKYHLAARHSLLHSSNSRTSRISASLYGSRGLIPLRQPVRQREKQQRPDLRGGSGVCRILVCLLSALSGSQDLRRGTGRQRRSGQVSILVGRGRGNRR